MKGITKRQREVLDFIDGYVADRRYSPTYREIRDHLNLSSLGTVYKHVQALKRKGVLDLEEGCSRSVAVSDACPVAAGDTMQVPLMGILRGRFPLETFAESSSVPLPAGLEVGAGTIYALEVQGDDLADELLAGGDTVFLDVSTAPANGDTIVGALNLNDTVVKRYYKEDGYIRLEGGHPNVQPFIVREGDLTLHGVVIAVARSY